jgi:hypothetical protein
LYIDRTVFRQNLTMKNLTLGSHIKKAFFLLMLVFGSFQLFAGEIILNHEKSGITFSGSSYQKLDFTLRLSSIQFQDIQTPIGSFTELLVDGYGFRNVAGDPKLPVFHKLIEAPLNSTFHITYGKIEYVEYDLASEGINSKLIPAQAPLSKNITNPAEIPFVFNSNTYQRNEFIGDELVTVTPVGVMRSVNLANLAIAPFLYNPVTNRIRVFTKIEVTVTFENADVTRTVLMKERTSSPFFGKLYSQLPNYQSNKDELITSGPVTYVIVSDPNFHDALQPFVQWKTQKGFKVIQAYTDDPAVGNTKVSIRDYLMGLYNAPPAGFDPPSFVLFAGDVGQIPAYNVNSHPTDLNYCDYTNDHIPEVYYGRFAAQNVTQLQAYIDKALEYEQYTMPVDTFLNEVAMVAGAQSGMEVYTNGQINYGTNTYFNEAHGINSHTYLQPEPGGGNYSQKIRNNVSNGVAFANYTAHGSESGWADPGFFVSHIAALQNIHKYPLMIGNCCKTSNFSVTCFAKEITRVADKGALGYIGCSDYSYWDEDYWWGCGFKTVALNPPYSPMHLGAYDITFHDHGEEIDKWFVTMGQMVVGGNLAVEESNSSIKDYYWETYCLMGDPSLSIYFSVPQFVTATYPDNLPLGTSSLTVNTEPYAYVSLSVHDTTLLDAKCADSLGVVNLVFDSVLDVCNLNIVISKQNRKPLIDSIPVLPFVLTIGASSDTLCKGESSQLSVMVNGGSGTFTYTWSPDTYLDDPAISSPVSTPETDIAYTVTVDDGIYSVTSPPVYLTVIPVPATPVITLHQDTLISDAMSGNQWYRYQEMITGATGQKYIPVSSGDYSVTVSDPVTGCSSLHSNVIPYYFTGVSADANDQNVRIYPNPFKDFVTVSYDLAAPGSVMISLYDAVGKEIMVVENNSQQDAGEHSIVMKGQFLDKGFYYIIVQTENYTVIRKLIVTK